MTTKLLLSAMILGLLGCNFEKSNEFTIYESQSQAERSTSPRLDRVDIIPVGDSLKVSLVAKAGMAESVADAAPIRFGLVNIDNTTWDTLFVDSSGAYYGVSRMFPMPAILGKTSFDVKVVDMFGRADSLNQIASTPTGVSKTRTYNSAFCNGQASCFWGGAPELSSSSGQSSSSSSPLTITKGTFKDTRDERTYKTVTIGKQTWMAEDLDFGTTVPDVQLNTYQSNDTLVEKYSPTVTFKNGLTAGGLYQWAEAMALPNRCNDSLCASSIHAGNHQGICPNGWHIPKSEEFETLGEALGGSEDTAGAKMKLNNTGFPDWDTTFNSNSSGFSALPVGSCDGGYSGKGSDAFYWGATERNASSAVYRKLSMGSKMFYDANPEVKREFSGSVWPKRNGFSVRCLKD
jgi:uncharacterized protein (TIGR02145 family)